MKTMKRFLAILLALTLALTLLACAGEAEEQPQSDPPQTGGAEPAAPADDLLNGTAQWLVSQIPEPAHGSVGGEWMVFGLARSGAEVPGGYFDNYFENLAAYTAEQGGVLHARKYTEYSRVILAVTAIGKDPRDVGGYNLLVPLADYEQTVFQGINGAIFALLALDSGNYEIPANTADSTQATRELYVDFILSAECTDGGWTLSGDVADVDITAMTLQALAKYQQRQDVAQAIDRGVEVLSRLQQSNGGYSAYDSESSESVAQVIVALSELGIDLSDDRFVKNGTTLKDRLLEFRLSDGSFEHIIGGGTDLMATEQAFYALAALERRENGQSSLYRISEG